MIKKYSGIYKLGDTDKHISIINFNTNSSELDYSDHTNFIHFIDLSDKDDFTRIIYELRDAILNDRANNHRIIYTDKDNLIEVRNPYDLSEKYYPNLIQTVIMKEPSVINYITDKSNNIDFSNFDESKIIAINTLGVGTRYNRSKLVKISNSTSFGVYTNYINYSDTYKYLSKNSRYYSDNILLFNSNDKNIDVYYSSSRVTKKISPQNYRIYKSDYKRNQFIIVSDHMITDNIDISYITNGDIISSYSTNSVPSSPIHSNWVESIMYRLAYSSYLTDRRFSLECIDYLRDEDLQNSHLDSFTFSEIDSHLSKLRNASISTKYRNSNNPNYFTVKDHKNYYSKISVIDILRIISNPLIDNYYYPDYDSYKRVTNKVVDKFDMFEYDTKINKCRLSDIVVSSDYLNISIRFRIDGIVHINPKQALKVGITDPNIRSHIYRTHTIISDGKLNINEIVVDISDESYSDLESLDNNISDIIDDVFDIDNSKTHKLIHLDRIPIINNNYSKISTSDVFNTIININRVKSYQKAIKQLIKEKTPLTGLFQPKYTHDQFELLKEYGINNKGAYEGINRVVDNKSETHSKRSISIFESGPKGGKLVIKSYNEMMKKFNKSGYYSLDEYSRNILDYYNDNRYSSLEELESSDKNLSSILNSSLFKLCASKIFIIDSGDWFDNVTKNNDNEYIYTDKDTNKSIIIRISK